MSLKHFLLWLPMILIAFGNATLRELVLAKHFTHLRAHQLSTGTLILLCAVYIWLVYPFLSIRTSKEALLMGAVWVVLTVLFEFSLGRFVNRSWENLLQDYNIFKGRIWPLFLISLLLLPCLFYSIRK